MTTISATEGNNIESSNRKGGTGGKRKVLALCPAQLGFLFEGHLPVWAIRQIVAHCPYIT